MVLLLLLLLKGKKQILSLFEKSGQWKRKILIPCSEINKAAEGESRGSGSFQKESKKKKKKRGGKDLRGWEQERHWRTDFPPPGSATDFH